LKLRQARSGPSPETLIVRGEVYIKGMSFTGLIKNEKREEKNYSQIPEMRLQDP